MCWGWEGTGGGIGQDGMPTGHGAHLKHISASYFFP